MAEALEVTAASIQIAGLLGKIVISSARLYEQLRAAPEEVLRKTRAIGEFRDLCESYQHTLTQEATNTNNGEQRDLSGFKALLEADTEIHAIEGIISTLKPQPTDGRLQSFRKAARVVHKDAGINKHLDRLNELRDKINSFLISHVTGIAFCQGYITRIIRLYTVLRS